MGKAAKVEKERTCLKCEKTIVTTSKGMRNHFLTCKQGRE